MFFARYIKVMIGYLTSYIKESPFVLFQPYAHSKLYFGQVSEAISLEQ
jgi:hypothetical protein